MPHAALFLLSLSPVEAVQSFESVSVMSHGVECLIRAMR